MSAAPLPRLSRRGREVVAAHGNSVALRGVGIGNWLLPEGYMWGHGPDAAQCRQWWCAVHHVSGWHRRD